MVEVRRKEGESSESLIRRFTRKVQQSGLLIRAKRRRFYAKDKNKRQLREEAVHRKALQEKREYLKRIGKLDDWLEQQGRRPYRGYKKN